MDPVKPNLSTPCLPVGCTGPQAGGSVVSAAGNQARAALSPGVWGGTCLLALLSGMLVSMHPDSVVEPVAFTDPMSSAIWLRLDSRTHPQLQTSPVRHVLPHVRPQAESPEPEPLAPLPSAGQPLRI